MNPFALQCLPERTTEELQARLRKLQHRDLQKYKTLTWERAEIRRELAKRLKQVG
jgi:hypothetical protein